MLGLCALGFAMGWVMRYNIRQYEPVSDEKGRLRQLERTGEVGDQEADPLVVRPREFGVAYQCSAGALAPVGWVRLLRGRVVRSWHLGRTDPSTEQRPCAP